MRRWLGAALDWRFAAVVARVDSLSGRIEQLEGGLESVTLKLRELASTLGELRQLAGEMPQAAADATAARGLLEHRVQPMLRAIVAEESDNRRRLYALRASPDYEAAYLDPSPMVSITVATRSRPELLVRRALPSLLAQTHANLEVLVVGDAASHDVAEAVAALGDARVRYANLSQRITSRADPGTHWLVGSTMARNEAARSASGRWLLHFDDDDHLRPDSIASLLELAREQHAEVAYGGFETHEPDGGVERSLAFPPQPGLFGWQGALLHAGLRFFERELVAAHLGVAGDMYLLERMLRAGVRFAMLDSLVWDYYPSSIWEPSSA
jgi:Glycosyl transferase family 2